MRNGHVRSTRAHSSTLFFLSLSSSPLISPHFSLNGEATSSSDALRRETLRTLTSDVFKISFLPYYNSMRLLKNKKPLIQTSSSAPRFSMRISSKRAYICRDYGYIYNDRTPFDKSRSGDSLCAAPKRRFRPYTPDVSKNVNDKDVRKAELQRDEAIGKALPIAIAVGVLALAALYFYVNNTA